MKLTLLMGPQRPGYEWLRQRTGRFLAVITIAACPAASYCEDCDRNGVEDATQIAADPSLDCGSNGRLDSCELATPAILLDAPRNWPTGDRIGSLEIADFDDDGRLDILGGARLFFGRLRSGLAVPPVYDFGGPLGEGELPEPLPSAGSPVAADLDLDGIIDIASVGGRGTVSVFRGAGDGTFAAPELYLTSDGSNQIHAGDLNGDGRTDLLTVSTNERRVSALLQEDDGGFQIHRDSTVDAQPRTSLLGDFDGDGTLDVLVGLRGATSEVVLMQGRGDGRFVRTTSVPTVTWPADFALADFDRDGELDLAVAGFDSAAIALHRGNGGGVFAAAVQIDVGVEPRALDAADLDGDGVLDLVTATRWQLEVLVGAGDGTFAPPRIHPGMNDVREVRVVDLDEDGSPDIAAAGERGLSVAFGRDGSTALSPLHLLPVAAHSFAVGDFNGDSFDDAATLLSFRRELRIHLADGAGGLADGAIYPIEPGSIDLSARDVTGDATLDLVVLDEEHVTVFPGNGDGTFTAGPVVALDPSRVHAWLDVDGDGTDDLARVVSVGEFRHLFIEVVKASGDGTFVPGPRTPVAYGSSLATGDFDGDRVPDVVLINTRDYRFGLFAGLGTGHFTPAGEFTIPGDRLVREALLVDTDGDLDSDLVVVRTDGMTVLLNDGSGGFGEQVHLSPEIEFDFVDAMDLDLDGIPEIVTTGERLGVYRTDSSGIPHSPVFFLPAHEVWHAGFGHIDGDGIPDLYTLHNPFDERANNGIVITRNLTTIRDSRDCDGNGRADSCDIASGESADIDGDGVPDECQPDCDENGRPDALDISSGDATDLDGNGVPDECQPDCNENGVPDSIDIATGSSSDLDGNRVPDDCQPDCNENGQPDRLDLILGNSDDRDENGVPDECQDDCNGNGTLDASDLDTHASFDRNGNGIPDVCDIATGFSADVDENRVPDEVESDCDEDGYPDRSAIRDGLVDDANRNGIPDSCDIASMESDDIDGNGVPDEAQPDCDGNGVPDSHEVAIGTATDCDGDGTLDACEVDPGAMSFGEIEMIELPGGVDGIAAGDLDGDGNTDIVWRFRERFGIGVARGDGFGGLLSPTEYEARDPGLPMLRDFDRDGVLDLLVTASFERQLAIFFGLGDGEFAPPVLHNIWWEDDRVGFLVIEDLDRNGTLDIVTIPDRQSVLQIFPGYGNGDLLPPFDVRLEEAPSLVEVADVNSDSLPDLIVAGDRERQVYLADGDGGFTRGESWSPTRIVRILEAFDFDRDGNVDLLGDSREHDGLTIWRGAGDGTFDEGTPIRSEFPPYVVIADLDHDGVDDIVSADYRTVFHDAGTVDGLPQAGSEFELGQQIEGLAVADFDRDGVLDVLVGDATFGGLALSRAVAPASFPVVSRIQSGPPGGIPVAADFDGDGTLDLSFVPVSTQNSIPVSVLFGNGTGRFVPGGEVEVPPWPSRVDVVDVLGDARPEMVIAHSGRAVEASILSVSVDRTQITRTAIAFGEFQEHVVARDVTADGLLDLVAAINSGLSVRRGRDGGTFSPPIESIGTSLNVIETIDVDRDGNADVVGVSRGLSPAQIAIYRGRGDGSFNPPTLTSTTIQSVESMLTMELDQDGFLDLVVASRERAEIALFRGTASGFSFAERIPLGNGWIEDLATGDWNRDGRVDIAAADSRGDTSSIVLLTATPTGSFDVATRLGRGRRVRKIASGDFDRNGAADLVGVDAIGVNEESPGPLLFSNRSPERAEDCDGNGVPDSCEELADCDGDGVSDACEVRNGTARDEDGDGIPDECETRCLVPGDCSEDGFFDISDPICLVGFLFLGAPERLPCGSGSADDMGNVELLDFQGDGQIDLSDVVAGLSFLFDDRPPHPLADRDSPSNVCVPFISCDAP